MSENCTSKEGHKWTQWSTPKSVRLKRHGLFKSGKWYDGLVQSRHCEVCEVYQMQPVEIVAP